MGADGRMEYRNQGKEFGFDGDRTCPIASSTVIYRIQKIILLLLCIAGTGFAQTVHCGISETDFEHRMHDLYGYPYEDRYTVRVLDYPLLKKPETLEPVKKFPVSDPFQAQLDKRMTAISATNFISTNTTPINIAPGLVPKN